MRTIESATTNKERLSTVYADGVKKQWWQIGVRTVPIFFSSLGVRSLLSGGDSYDTLTIIRFSGLFTKNDVISAIGFSPTYLGEKLRFTFFLPFIYIPRLRHSGIIFRSQYVALDRRFTFHNNIALIFSRTSWLFGAIEISITSQVGYWKNKQKVKNIDEEPGGESGCDRIKLGSSVSPINQGN